MAENNEIKVKSLQKALEILNLFTEKPVLGVTEVSEYFGLYKSTVHNILSTLKAMEYLEQDEETGKYRLGIQIFNLSKALGDTYSITDERKRKVLNVKKHGFFAEKHKKYNRIQLKYNGYMTSH